MSRDSCQARLLGAALDAAHPDYFAGVERGLLERARRSPVGRRMLLRQLLAWSRSLLADLSSLDDETIEEHPWVLWDAVKLHDTAADLGAIALVPGLRTCVDRASVLRLRGAIGSTRLAMAITCRHDEQVPDAVAALARRAVAHALGSADAIAALVARNGYRELAGYADHVHPAIGERVRLAFRPSWRADPRGTWLPRAAVARFFAGQPGEDVQQDAMPSCDEAPSLQAGEIAA